MLYKSGLTTYVVKNIPVGLWKKCKTKFLHSNSGEKSMGELIVKLLENWIKEGRSGKWN
tara:strand:+ start:365 stop:541 length:177 start_codon:yes stop_codon:yes gene_type:complete